MSEYDAIFAEPVWTTSPNALGVVERAAAELQLGFKMENTLGGPRSHGRAWVEEQNWLRKK